MGIANNILFFLIAVACLISIHEFGHFLVARIFRTEVEVFSIGFGKPIFAARILEGRTLFQVCWFPIGGYVKFAEASIGGAAARNSSEESQFFASKSPGVRMAIAAAGPLANVVLAVFIFTIVFFGGSTVSTTQVGYVEPGSPAAVSGLVSGDSILQISGRDVDSWEDVVWELIRLEKEEEVTIKIRRMVNGKPDILVLDPVLVGSGAANLFGILHNSQIFDPVIGRVQQFGPAEVAGLREGDVVRSVNGKPVQHWLQFVDVVRDAPGEQLIINLTRDGAQHMVRLRPDVKKVMNGEIGWIGAAPAPPRDKGQQAKVNIETDLYAEIHKSLLKSFVRTADLLEMTWRVIAGIFVGDVSIGNISGPISIAGHAGSSSQAGFYSFLFFLGVLSISVAVINLLPLPALDGGQIILFIFEALRGVPFSAGFLSWWTRIGAVTIAGIMVLALANDIYTVFK